MYKLLLKFLLSFIFLSSVQSSENFPSILFSSTKLQQNKKKQTATSSITLSVLTDASCYYNEAVSVPGKNMLLKNKGPLILPEQLREKIQLFFFNNKYEHLSSESLIKTEFTGVWLSELSLEYKDFRKTIRISNNTPSFKELTPEGYELLELLHEIIIFAETE